MEREQIIKALECCIKAETWGDCEDLGCPAHTKQGCYFYLRTDDDYENTIYIELCKDALSLIKELTEDNEYLKTQLTAAEARYESRKESDLEEVLELRLKVEELTEENERLREDNEIKSQKRANIFEIANAFERGRTNGVRKMQERLKEKAFSVPTVYNSYFGRMIDQIAKEMLKGKEET